MSKLQRMAKSVTLKVADSADHDFEGYLSTYGNVDRDGDVFVKGCYDESLKNRTKIPMLYGHDYRNVENALGGLEMSSDDHGLFVKGTFGTSDKAQNIKELVKMGAITTMSVGCFIQDYEPRDTHSPYAGNSVTKADIVEGSIVPVPANPEANITFIKSLLEDDDSTVDALLLIQDMIDKGVKKALDENQAKVKDEKRQAILETLKGIN